MKLKIKNHYAAVLNQAHSDNLKNVSSESSPLANNYDYSFTNPEIHTTLRTSRSSTAPGADGIPTRVLQSCELEEDAQSVLSSHSIICDNRNTFHDK